MLKSHTTRSCFIYDPDDGRIVHVHQEFTLEGAVEPSDSQIEEKARRLAEHAGRDLTGMSVLFAKDTRAKNTAYRVDPATESLVPADS